MSEINDNQIKSKERVANHGEVFTSEKEVNAMLDLVKQETERIDARFLEPACGHGNFLIKILERKMNVVETSYKTNQVEYEKYAVLAVSSIYGVDLQEDNIIEARERLISFIQAKYTNTFATTKSVRFLETIKYILSRNLIVGDALTMKVNERDPIIFSEWSFKENDNVIRRDFSFEKILNTQTELSTLMAGWNINESESDLVMSQTPLKEFSAKYFLDLPQFG